MVWVKESFSSTAELKNSDEVYGGGKQDEQPISQVKRSLPKLDYDDEAVQKTLRFALEELGKNYDTTSAILSVIPWHSSQHPARCDSYFCSEFVVMALQRLDGLVGVDAKHTTPNALFQKLATERI